MKNEISLKGCRRYLLLMFIGFILIIAKPVLHAQTTVQKPARILFLLDASSSMGNSWADAHTRFQTAARIVNTIVDSIHKVNPDVAFAVRVFGNQYPAQEKNCFDSKLEVEFNLGNDEQIKARLKYLTPRGYSPIAWSLQQAAEKDFKEDDHYAYSIILITDGGESCGGDICATVTNLLDKKISFKPYILSLIDYEPLKLEYACLGKYLTIAKENDIIPAVGTIINDNKKVLVIKTSDYHPIAIDTKPAKAQKVEVPAITFKTEKEEPKVVAPEKPKPEPVVEKATPPATKPVAVTKPEPVMPKPEPVVVRKAPAHLDLIYMNTQLTRMNLLYTIADAAPVAIPKLKPMKIDIPGLDPEPVVAAPTPTKKPIQSNVIPASKPPVSAPSATPKNTIVEPVASIQKPKIISPKKAEKKDDINLPIQSTEQDAKESSLQIYFTNGKGKFYKTEPKLVFSDSKSKAEVKSVFRNLEGGEPTPIKMPPGTYDLKIPGSRGKANNIVVEAGKNKKVYITVGVGTLEFAYPTAPNRPVKEYTALVSKRFEPGPVTKQACDTSLPYEPASYHIEVNTLPPTTLYVDLDFYSTKVMSIPEAGTVKITNINNKGKVQFWCQHGDAYEPFHEMNIPGDPAKQTVDFLPGLYQVRYYNGARSPMAKAEVIYFRVKSNMTTTLDLQ